MFYFICISWSPLWQVEREVFQDLRLRMKLCDVFFSLIPCYYLNMMFAISFWFVLFRLSSNSSCVMVLRLNYHLLHPPNISIHLHYPFTLLVSFLHSQFLSTSSLHPLHLILSLLRVLNHHLHLPRSSRSSSLFFHPPLLFILAHFSTSSHILSSLRLNCHCLHPSYQPFPYLHNPSSSLHSTSPPLP